jgi:exopolysaccharide biosynthesis polyprenyl glycosylphosphotransferase
MTTTQRIEPYAGEVLEVDDDDALRNGREISIFVQPDVALHQSKAGTTRRLFARRALRTVAFATCDTAAAAVAAIAVRRGVEVAGLGHVPFSSASEFAIAVLLALALTGNYRRATPTRPTQHLLLGSALGSLVVFWARVWPALSVDAVALVTLLTLCTAGALFVTRATLAALTGWLLPDARRLVPAIVIVGGDDVEATLSPDSGFRVAGTLMVDGRQAEARAQDLARLIRRARAESVVVLGDLKSAFFARVLEISLRAGCEVLTTPPGYGVVGVRPVLTRRGPYGLIQVGAPSLKTPQFVVKRLVDVAGACIAMVVTAPVWLLIAIVIRLDSPGPIFFSQFRIGLGGQRFRMIKFRSMRMGANGEKARYAHLNASGDPRNFKIVDDPRISRIGGFLRRWSLDELPQFLNVLFGQMSLVGPRPVPEEDFVGYHEHHFRRLGAKPGITGLWQVSGRSAVCDFEERVRLDTEYIDRWSLWLDLKILTQTLPAVVGRTGAY